ncbi:MAG: Tol-Pal system beta propeller repeat protein TolB [Burkholderiales bacterium]
MTLNHFDLRRRALLGLAAGSALSAGPAWAQLRVEVTGIGATQLPIAVPDFFGDAAAPQKIGAIVRADLLRSGRFKAIDTAPSSQDVTARPNLPQVRQSGADSLVAGSVTRLADGRFDVRFRLWDAVQGTELAAQSFAVQANDLRLAAHRMADVIYEKLTGEKGVFSTRLAYVTQAGPRHSLWVADADGENAQSALASPEPIISPAWSPTGGQLAYVSFESRKAVIYVHEVASGKRRLLANFKGSNSAPAWSPDGQSLALTLSREGSSQIYAMSAAGGEPRRLTQSASIDTEAAYAPDGKSIYFVSDRGGGPQIYRMAASGEAGGGAERITFTGSYNISPTISPDGRWLAYIARQSGMFKLTVMELGTANANPITETSADEKPGFSPNSRLIVYATVLQGRQALMVTTLDGKVKTRLAGQAGDIREPDWGPFQAI